MATTTATITLASSDITGDTLSLSTTATLTKADSNEGLDQTQGIGRKTTTSNSQYVLYNGDDYTTNKAHKVYLKNMSSSNMEYMTVHVNAEELGRLYGGDVDILYIPGGGWAFLPIMNGQNLKAYAATSGTVVEFMVFGTEA